MKTGRGNREELRCPACRGKLVAYWETRAYQCVHQGCPIHEEGVPFRVMAMIIGLLEDRERAGFRRGVAAARDAVDAVACLPKSEW